MRERATDVPAHVAVLESANHHGVQHRSGHDTELSGTRHSVCKPPIGNGDAHAALNDSG